MCNAFFVQNTQEPNTVVRILSFGPTQSSLPHSLDSNIFLIRKEYKDLVGRIFPVVGEEIEASTTRES